MKQEYTEQVVLMGVLIAPGTAVNVALQKALEYRVAWAWPIGAAEMPEIVPLYAPQAASAPALKLFTADVLGIGGLKALASVLPSGTDLWPVGGITPGSMPSWVAAGTTGFGIGSQLCAPGADAAACTPIRREQSGALWLDCARASP